MVISIKWKVLSAVRQLSTRVLVLERVEVSAIFCINSTCGLSPILVHVCG